MKRQHMKPVLIALAALPLLAGCATNPPGRIGQSFRTGPIVVRPMSVIEDSRCPKGTQCVWAGRIVVKSRIDLPNDYTVVRDLALGVPTQLAGGLLTLTDAEPQARKNREIPDRKYRFRFTYTPVQPAQPE